MLGTIVLWFAAGLLYGSRPVRTVRRAVRAVVWTFLAITILLALAGCGAGRSDHEDVARAVNELMERGQTRDWDGACRMLTPQAQRDLVLAVPGVDATCPRALERSWDSRRETVRVSEQDVVLNGTRAWIAGFGGLVLERVGERWLVAPRS